MKTLKEKDVRFVITPEPEEDLRVRGNASAIDPETDAAIEQEIIRRLNNGEEWAWCCVEVKAIWEDFEGTAYLGGCSYADEADFSQEGGYLKDLKAEALADLNRNVRAVAAKINKLR